MKGSAHLPLKGRIDHLVLLDPALAYERSGGDASSEMVAIASEVGDNHLGIWECLLDKPLDFSSRYCHRRQLQMSSAPPCKVGTKFRGPLKIHKNEANLGAFPAPFH